MSNLAHKLPSGLKVAHKAQRTTSDLLMLMLSVNFDKSRIIIAEHEISEHFLTVYLEDSNDFKNTLEECLMYKLPVSQFASIITNEKLNSYPGVKYTESGRAYDADIEINEPISWYNEDATLYEQGIARDAALAHILKTVSK